MRKEIPTWVAGVVIVIVLLLIAGVYLLISRPQTPTERPPIEEGIMTTARPGGPMGQPGATPTTPSTGAQPSQPPLTTPR